ncbi:type II secretion system F family protein [Alphaproteobacteria bacterium endosymbiont of Tiliacea citrago]|uniref:type II secretion system F family protein n=1 Tax=Alphaproteobacteria bacterium endosymbiont of Tiliacea citrago TaxID=3077944 RepID=UPI00313B7431
MKTKVFYSTFYLKDFMSFKNCVFNKRKVTNSEVLIFFKSVFEFFNVYDNIVQCLESSLHSISNQREAFINMINSVKKGSSFSLALKNANITSETVVNIMKAGEKNNDFLGSLKLVVEFLEKNQNQKSELFRTLFYPVFTFFAFFSTLITFSRFVVPSMIDCMIELNEDALLNFVLVKRVLFGLELFFSFFFFSLLVLFFLYRFKSNLFEFVCLKIPFIRNFLIYSNIYLFCYYMKISLKNSLSVGEALDISIDSCSTYRFKSVLQNAKKKLLTGNELSCGLNSFNFTPTLFLDILRTGEKANNLLSSFEIGENLFKSKLDNLTSSIIVILPVFLIVFIALFLVCFISCFFIPLYGVGV